MSLESSKSTSRNLLGIWPKEILVQIAKIDVIRMLTTVCHSGKTGEDANVLRGGMVK